MALSGNEQTQAVMARLGFGLRTIHRGPHPKYSGEVTVDALAAQAELNSLLDSGAITREQYDAEARAQLEAMQRQRAEELTRYGLGERLALDDDSSSALSLAT